MNRSWNIVRGVVNFCLLRATDRFFARVKAPRDIT